MSFTLWCQISSQNLSESLWKPVNGYGLHRGRSGVGSIGWRTPRKFKVDVTSSARGKFAPKTVKALVFLLLNWYTANGWLLSRVLDHRHSMCYPLSNIHYPGLSSSKLHCVAGILGLSKFYHSDRQHLATTLEPILLRKHVHWQWEAGTQASFQEKHANRFQPPLLLRWAKRVHGGLRLFPIQHGSRTVIYYGRRLRVACGFCFQDT